MSLTALLAALTAFFTFGVSTGYNIIPWIAAGAMCIAALTGWRVRNRSPLVVVCRIVIVGITLLRTMGPWAPESIDSSEMVLAHTLGLWCIAELALQAWLVQPVGGGNLAIVLLSALIMMAASNTFDNPYFLWLLPLYLLLLVRSWADIAPPRTWRGAVFGWLALVGALLIGGSVTYAVWRYRFEISGFSTRLFSPALARRIGLSTSPELGATFNPAGDVARVLRVRGLAAPSYLRAMAFETYHAGKWEPQLQRRRLLTIKAAAFAGPANLPHATVQRLGDADATIYTPLHAAGVALDPRTYLEWGKAHGGPLRFAEAPPPRSYDLVPAPSADYQGPFCVAPLPAQRPALLFVPPGLDPQVRALAHHITRRASTPRERIRAVCAYLEANHRYSLTMAPGSGDPVARFLIGHKAAHCEYFASAATLLLRYAGVPTRYVIGYYAHEFAGGDGLIVRQRDAHAWAESWIDGYGWVTVEATPADGRPDQLAEPVGWWTRLRERLSDMFAAAAAFFGKTRFDPKIALLAVLLALGMILLWRRRPRRSRTATDAAYIYTAASPELAALGASFERWLRRQGYSCPPGRTWHEHVAHLDRAGLDFQSDMHAFLALYNRLRFSTGDVTEEVTALENLLARLSRKKVSG